MANYTLDRARLRETVRTPRQPVKKNVAGLRFDREFDKACLAFAQRIRENPPQECHHWHDAPPLPVIQQAEQPAPEQLRLWEGA